ncbi:MAG: serine/threonine-protein kinase, partial [Planctomycetota bacterium]
MKQNDRVVRKLFDELMQLSDEDRERRLQAAEIPDDTRDQVRRLVEAAIERPGFLSEPAADLRFPIEELRRWADPDELLVGEQIDGWTLEGVIASGGMGTVYQASGSTTGDTVAIKLMRAGVASESAMRRFRFEAEVLARLDHPGIARVLDTGTHDSGTGGVPFFVMEYVADAQPISDYADARNLDVRKRLALFARVCDAVHHGHQKGVIHRDLKPANILVDAAGKPKVIDFGVARATDADLAVTTLATSAGDLLGTLQYMSPEQCGTDPGNVDIRSDIYSLGVVLYE